MTQEFKPNIFNIPSNYHFFDSLLDWLQQNFGENIGEVKVFFPNRRACREFSDAFVRHFGCDIAMPKFKAIGDISFDDFLDSFPRQKISYILDEISKIKCLNGFDYLFFLSREIINTRVFGENISFTQALSYAMQLRNLFDDLEKQEIDLQLLHEIDDSDLAAHRQFTLEFLKKFYFRIKNLVLKNNIFSQAAYQNFIINKLAQSIKEQGLKSPLIIAGSTGSVNFSKKLIEATAHDKNGHIVLYGLWKNHSDKIEDKTHPQFILQELLKSVSLANKEIKNIAIEKFKICQDHRLDFLNYLMMPTTQTHKWQGLANEVDLNKIADDFEKNFSYLETQTEVEEARVVANIALRATKNNKKVAIISTDKKFVALLKGELQKISLSFNDARSLDLSSSRLVNLVLLFLELQENNFDSVTLLEILKHSYSPYNLDKNLVDFEIKILREQRSEAGLQGIQKKIKLCDEKLQVFFNDFLQSFSSFINIVGEVEIGSYIKSLVEAIENFTKKSIADLIALESASEELSQLFEKITMAHGFSINTKDGVRFFKNLFLQISYFEKSVSEFAVQILSPIEARLLNFDLVILSSLNQGIFPQIEGENWLGKKIRKDLGIDLAPKKIGQNAYDFCNYLSNSSVVVTRSQSINGVPVIASPFILRFEILCKKFNIKISDIAKYYASEDLIILDKKSCVPLIQATPPKEFRPKKLTITDISKLINNPYQIYVRKILQLQEICKIDYEPTYKEFGTFVHKALEEFIKKPQSAENFLLKAQEIFTKYFISEESKLIWWPKFENIFKNFIKENEALEACKDYVEIPVKIMIKDVLLSGKIDRVSFFANEQIEIFDYKTGQFSSTKNVISGIEPQLTISALMLCLGVIENCGLKNISSENIRALNYWKLSSFGESEIKAIAKNNEEVAIMISAAKVGLERLFEYFANEENGYFATDNFDEEYLHLARIF